MTHTTARLYGTSKGCWGRAARHWRRMLRGPVPADWESALDEDEIRWIEQEQWTDWNWGDFWEWEMAK